MNKIQQKKNALLIIDEVKIRSSVAFSGGVMNEAAKNDPDSMSIINAVRDAEMLAWWAECDDLNYTCTQTDC